MIHNTKPVAVSAACTVITTDASSTHAATLYVFCISSNHSNNITAKKMNLYSTYYNLSLKRSDIHVHTYTYIQLNL